MRKTKREKQSFSYRVTREDQVFNLIFLVGKGNADKNGNARCIVDLIENGDYKESYIIYANYLFKNTIIDELVKLINNFYLDSTDSEETYKDPLKLIDELVSNGIFTENELSLIEFIPDNTIAINTLDNYLFYKTGFHLYNIKELREYDRG